jgi:formiminotetrahydrofolate cyclodeaminase
LNVKTNAAGLDDEKYVAEKLSAGQQMIARAEALEAEILKMVESAG